VRSLHELRKLQSRVALLSPWLAASAQASADDRVGEIRSIAWRKYTFRYPGAVADALVEISVSHRTGSLLVVVGANGSGKSTLLKSLLGLGGEEHGEILDGEKKLPRHSAWRSRIAYLPQRPYLGDRVSVRAALGLVGDSISDADARIWLERTGSWSVLEHKSAADPLATNVGTLSSGERQRLALARFFARDRDVYLLDEPDANLDAAGIEVTRSVVGALAKEKLVIVAAHSAALVDAADSVVRLEKGRVVPAS
ncbi:MAG TPA: ATP-binding cassette domain-containing protein, partial [Polyangiaceae bacterium]